MLDLLSTVLDSDQVSEKGSKIPWQKATAQNMGVKRR